MKLLVDIHGLVKGVKREDVATQSLDSIIRPRLLNLHAYIGSKYPEDLTLDEILYETEILQTLDRQGFEGLPLVDLDELRLEWMDNLAWTSGEKLKVSALFTYDLYLNLLICDSAIEEAGTVGTIKLLVGVDREDR